MANTLTPKTTEEILLAVLNGKKDEEGFCTARACGVMKIDNRKTRKLAIKRVVVTDEEALEFARKRHFVGGMKDRLRQKLEAKRNAKQN